MRRLFIMGAALLLLLILAWHVLGSPEDRGNSRFFADQTYNFETLRVLTDTSVVGGDTNEVLRAIDGLKAGDADGWYTAWKAAGDRVSVLADHTTDPISKGRALLRAHNYYRSAEFFLVPQDKRRPAIWKQNVDAFYAGLDALEIKHVRFTVPYGKYHLNAVYYPGPAGSEKLPLLVVVNGYDGTMEELYFSVVEVAYQRGYSVLTYEGPGQGSVLREQGLTMTPDWEKPNGAVLNTYLSTHPAPGKIVLIGESLGGYLAARAAAFDSRISGVVAYDVFYDGGAIASRKIPAFVPWLVHHGYGRVLKFLSGLKSDPGSTWAQQNGMWVFGLNNPLAVLDAFKAYTLAPVAARISSDVLILAGADDHFVPLQQVDEFKRSLTHARSVSSIVFDRESGGSEHCQIGAPSLWQAALFDWLEAKYGQLYEAKTITDPVATQQPNPPAHSLALQGAAKQ